MATRTPKGDKPLVTLPAQRTASAIGQMIDKVQQSDGSLGTLIHDALFQALAHIVRGGKPATEGGDPTPTGDPSLLNRLLSAKFKTVNNRELAVAVGTFTGKAFKVEKGQLRLNKGWKVEMFDLEGFYANPYWTLSANQANRKVRTITPLSVHQSIVALGNNFRNAAQGESETAQVAPGVDPARVEAGIRAAIAAYDEALGIQREVEAIDAAGVRNARF
jgi:hypothetical protein